MNALEGFLYPRELLQRTRPVNLEGKDARLFAVEFDKLFDAVKSIRYKRVFVLSNGAVVRHKVFTDAFYNKATFKQSLILYIRSSISLLRSRKRVTVENALLLSDHYSDAFFHWFGDVLQRLEALESHNIDLSKHTLLIPSSDYYSYVDASLKPYDIDYMVIDDSQIVYAKELFVIPQITPTGNFRPELMCNMRSRFEAHHKVSSKEQRTYITRAKAKKRTIVNEAGLMPILRKHGFKIVAMEDLTFQEQYQVIAESSVLVSLHGAGLTHMMWMKEGSKVLEVRAVDDHTNNCYFSLASDLKLEYYYTLANKSDKNASTQQSDFIVDLQDIEEQIEHMLKEKIVTERERLV